MIKVLEREITKVVGEFQSNKTFGFVIADEKKFNQDIYIPKKYSVVQKMEIKLLFK